MMASHKIKVIFEKTGDMKFISHLDVMRLFQRSSRRAGLPVSFTQGSSPHLKISILNALKLGRESTTEEAVFYMDERIEAAVFLSRINKNLPCGMRVTKAEWEKIDA
jgi:radical SAM-linked protein